MNALRWLSAGVSIGAILWAAGPAPAQEHSDVEQGKKLYAGMCVTCHGFEGTGGEAPSLNRARLERAPDEETLRAVIGDGIPARGMPRVRRMTGNEVRQLAAYVRSLGRTAPSPVDGDAQKGRDLYRKHGCAACHIIDGQGSSLGPVLTGIGALRAPEHLQQSMVDPGAVLPRATLVVPARGFNEYLPVRVVTRDGRELRGMRLNEDNFTIQLRDANNRFHTYRKTDLKQIEKESGASLMPSYKDRLTPAELSDLVAYLASLRGAS